MLYFTLLFIPFLAIIIVLRFITVRILLLKTRKRKISAETSIASVIKGRTYDDTIFIQTKLINSFLDELNNIDFEYLFFFLFRQPVTSEDVRDRLSNHYKLELKCGKAYFEFLPTSDLPARIRKKCTEKFVNYFEDGVLIENYDL